MRPSNAMNRATVAATIGPRAPRARRLAPALAPALALSLALAGAGAAVPADAAPVGRPAWVIVTAALEGIPASVVSGVGEDTVAYVDPIGQPQTIPAAEVLGFAPGWWWRGERPAEGAGVEDAGGALLRLTDGSVLTGRLGLEVAADSVVWSHPALGRLVVALEAVRSIRPQGGPAPAGVGGRSGGRAGAPATTDVVQLANGDRLAGFVAGVGTNAEGVAQVTVEAEGKETSVPLERVAEVRLVNPPAAPPPARLWLRDGTVAPVVKLLQREPNRLTARLNRRPGAMAEQPVDVANVAAASLDARRLTALADWPVVLVRPLGGRRWTRGVSVAEEAVAGPALLAAPLLLPGAMAAEWSLPDGAERVAMGLEMAAGAEPWGACRVRISLVAAGPGDGAGAIVLAEESLAAGSPGAAVNVALPAGPGGGPREGTDGAAGAGAASGARERRLRIEVEPGPHGVVQDWVLLRRAMVLVGGPEASAAGERGGAGAPR